MANALQFPDVIFDHSNSASVPDFPNALVHADALVHFLSGPLQFAKRMLLLRLGECLRFLTFLRVDYPLLGAAEGARPFLICLQILNRGRGEINVRHESSSVVTRLCVVETEEKPSRSRSLSPGISRLARCCRHCRTCRIGQNRTATRPRFQYSLRTLLILVTLAAIPCAVVMRVVRQRQAAERRELEERRAADRAFRKEFIENWGTVFDGKNPAPSRHRRPPRTVCNPRKADHLKIHRLPLVGDACLRRGCCRCRASRCRWRYSFGSYMFPSASYV